MNTAFLIALPLLLLTLWLSVKWTNILIKIPVPNVAYSSIDGVRGYLAFGVFLHHAWIWHEYLASGTWEAPSIRYAVHLGQASVAFFFMITAFLFFGRMLDEKPMDWKAYYKSRWFRIAPLYFLSIIILLILALLQTGISPKVSISEFWYSIYSWLAFTIPGIVDINGLDKTYIINAGVTWSLVYEWLFYMVLPILAFAFKQKISWKFLLIGIIGLLYIVLSSGISLSYLYPFVGGLIAAIIVKKGYAQEIFRSNWMALLCLAIGLGIAIFARSAYKPIPLLGYTLIFIAIGSGNSFFGILHQRVSKELGQITYSMYLLHGIVLYCFLQFSNISASKFEPWEYWLLITAIIPVVVLICQLTYKYIEIPGIKLGKK